jgi:hydrogenase nickel incorporation protein HypA/HybF
MHELSVSSAVVDTVLRHAAGRRVTAVQLRVGALRQVVPDSLDFYWGIVTRDTLCEGSVLEQELVAVRLRCEDCATEWEVSAPDFRCPGCGARATVVAGEELEVESIDVVREEEPCIA